MKLKYLFLIITLVPLTATAQYSSRLGRFRVDEKKGCASFTVTILDTNLITVGQCTGANPCDMTWGDGTSIQQNVFTHTYTQPGTYKLEILYQNIGIDDISITVTPNTAPAFDIYTCGNREVQVKVTDTNYDAYIINYNDGTAEVTVLKGSSASDNHIYATAGAHTVTVRGNDLNADDNCFPGNSKPVTVVNSLSAPFIDLLTVTSSSQIDLDFNNASYSNNVLYKVEIAPNSVSNFQAAQTIHDVTTTSATGLRTDDNYYCFRLGAFDPCLNTTIRSNIICSANFDLTPQSNVNNLSWTSSTTGVSNFNINRDGSNIGTTGTLSFADNTVVCNTDYCYQLVTTYSNGSQSISLEKCGTAFSTETPTAISNITSIVGNGSVDLVWQQDPAFQTDLYSIFRKSGSGSFTSYATASATQLTDNLYNTAGEYCYQMNYLDDCGNASAIGAEVCPIRLSGKVNNDNSITLNWSDYNGWLNGVSQYIVEKYDAQGNLIQTFPNGTSTTFNDNAIDPLVQVYVYLIKADANTGGLGQSISNDLKLVKEPNIYYPKAFTPNDDNLNDTFLVFGQYVDTFEMKIFNRWGELLFTTNNLLEGWDGKFKGTNQPEGTYAFIAKITDLNGHTFDRSGSFVLLRRK